jgi:hypothetical protein
MPSLLSPVQAGERVAAAVNDVWPELLSAELTGTEGAPIAVKLRTGVSSSAEVVSIGITEWYAWQSAWRSVDLADLSEVDVESTEFNVRGNPVTAPLLLRVRTLEAAVTLARSLGYPGEIVDTAQVRRLGERLDDVGGVVTPATLRAVGKLSDADVVKLLHTIAWLRDHPQLDQWTVRQLPIPQVDTKWLSGHESLVKSLAGRDVRREARPRLAVVHFTYLDPDYRASGKRRHDAWTSGDSHVPAYRPEVVLVVENRDCRLWFPTLPGAIVVEGEGKAAGSLASIDWVRDAGRLVYWGDIDGDGFSILNAFRAELREHGRHVDSLLMDGAAYVRYAHLGVNHDKRGEPLPPSNAVLPELNDAEAECYARVATSGPVTFRRIEQERVPPAEACAELQRLLEPAQH